MEDPNKRPPYPLGDLTPEEIEQLRQSKKEIAKRVKELWNEEQNKKFLKVQGAHIFKDTK